MSSVSGDAAVDLVVDEVIFGFVFSFAQLAPVGRSDRFLRFGSSFRFFIVNAKTARAVGLVLVDLLPRFEDLAAVGAALGVVVEVFGQGDYGLELFRVFYFAFVGADSAGKDDFPPRWDPVRLVVGFPGAGKSLRVI